MNPVRLTLASIGAVVAITLVVLTGTSYSVANDWAAVVDDVEIDEREFLRELDQFRDNAGLAQFFPGLGAVQPGSVPAELSSVWLSRLIQQEFVDRIFEDRNLQVTEDLLRQAEQINLQQFQGEEVWTDFDAWFRERMLRRDARFLAVAQSLGGVPSEEELRAVYAEQQDRFLEACSAHILVETAEEAAAIKAELDAGGDFAAIAAERSIDPGSGPSGGDLGCQRRGSFVEPFDSQVFTLELNTVSEPIQTQFGFHIVRVERRDVLPFEEARAELEQELAGQGQQELATMLFEMVAEASIEVNPKYGAFEVTGAGPQVSPPVAPTPPDGLPVDGAEAEIPAGDLFIPPPQP